MAVIIKDIDKPSTCGDCNFYIGGICLITDDDVEYEDEILLDCPLRDVDKDINVTTMTGKWIYDGDCIICNQCKKAYNFISLKTATPFCPNCGALMLGNKLPADALSDGGPMMEGVAKDEKQ